MLLQHPAKLGVLRGDVRELLERGERLKFCFASAMKPFAAYSLASFR